MDPVEVDDGEEQTFLSHLIELRSRLLKAVAAILVILVALLPFSKRLYGLLAHPLLAHLPVGGHVVATEVTSPFLVPLKLSFFVAIVAAMPFVLYQFWAFVSPGLYKREKRLAVPLLVSAIGLFYLGCAFAYFVVLPAVFTFMAHVAPEGVTVMPDISHLLDFALVLFLAFGLCFEVPVALVILVAIGVVTPHQLSSNRPYMVVAAFVVAAVVTPPDVFSMIMLAVPMCLLYEAGIIASRALARSNARADHASENRTDQSSD